MSQLTRLNTTFSTADAERPEIRYCNGELFLTFKDWQNKSVSVLFTDPVAFKWEEADCFYEGERDDSCYVIENSEWIAAYLKHGDISKNEAYQHYKFNFNSIGQLEVIALSFLERT